MLTRFAPSPTGPLHLGHAFSAILAHDRAMAARGTFLLRIEDLDPERSRPEWESQIFSDLAWLGLTWPEPVLRQSQRQAAYDAALDLLWAKGLLYPCFCNRRDILAAAGAPQEASLRAGPDGIVYPGTCRPAAPPTGPRPSGEALRLDIARALSGPVRFTETGAGPHGQTGVIETAPRALMDGTGDAVLARRGWGSAYHLAVVVDDAAQGVTEVTCGEDLFDATPLQVLLQTLLDLPTPSYFHHRLIRDRAGKRLAKRDDARALSKFRAEGLTPADIRQMVGLPSPNY